MDPSADASQGAGARVARRLRARADGDGPVSFAEFMDVALFDPEVGYYATRRARVGRGGGTDFYTASTFAGVFGPLVAAAAENLVGGAHRAREHAFVEIGAEPERALLDGVPHPFGATACVRLGEPRRIPERAVVFSNELFDAQPFYRLVWRAGAWRELGVAWSDGALAWVELPELSAELRGVAPRLPVSAEDGYTLDVPWRAVRLLEEIAAPGWNGLFLAFDYGRTWGQITTEFPQGTGRAYAGHRQSGDLLATPGEQDLTCHVCWDWLEEALRAAGFQTVCRESQEAFFVRHAAPAIEAIMRREASPLAPARSQLKQLLHPGLMGHRFEALWGLRA